VGGRKVSFNERSFVDVLINFDRSPCPHMSSLWYPPHVGTSLMDAPKDAMNEGNETVNN